MELYMVMLYSDVIELYDNNLAQISNIPVSQADIMNATNAEKVHRVSLRHADITGAGLLSSVGNFLKSPKLKGVVEAVKDYYVSPAGKQARSFVKDQLRSFGHPNLANTLHSVGFGSEEMDGGRRRTARKYKGNGMSGGAYATNEDLGDSLYE
jgi:hypothetical protein